MTSSLSYQNDKVKLFIYLVLFQQTSFLFNFYYESCQGETNIHSFYAIFASRAAVASSHWLPRLSQFLWTDSSYF